MAPGSSRVSRRRTVTSTGTSRNCWSMSCAAWARWVRSRLDTGAGATATFTADCTAQNFFATSDVNLKHEIRQIEGAVSQCQKLRGVEFKWKSGDDKRDQMGVIAQEVEAVYPCLVAEIDGHKRVDYSKLVGLLIEAVKELKQESAELRAEIADLRAK